MQGKDVGEAPQLLASRASGKQAGYRKNRKGGVEYAPVFSVSDSVPQAQSFPTPVAQQTVISLLCRDVMSADPTYCLPSDPVDGVAQLMVLQGVESLPVVQDAQTSKLIGLVTDRNLTVRVVAEGRDPKGTIIEEIMMPEPVTCRPTDDVQQALENMVEHQLRRLPVVDDNGFLIGVIAQADIVLSAAAAAKTASAGDGRPAAPLQSE